MRKKRLVNILTSAALTAVMVMSMGMTAMADTTQATDNDGTTYFSGGSISAPITAIELGKTVKTDGNTYKPNTTFNFTVAAGEADSTYAGGVVYAGNADGATGGMVAANPSGASITFTASSSDELSTEYTGSTSLSVGSYTKPGIYHYIVEETEGTYDGITYTQDYYDVYVYVYTDVNSGTGAVSYYVGNVVAIKGTKSTNGDVVTYIKGNSKSNLNFDNDYGADTTIDSTHDLTVKKVLAGDQAYYDSSFDFSIKITAASSASSNELYKMEVYQNGSNTPTSTITLTSGVAKDISLGNDEYVVIYGLSEGDVYEVYEKSYSSDGYTTSVKKYINENEESTATIELSEDTVNDIMVNKVVAKGENSCVVTDDHTKIEFTNEKNSITPTGIILNFAPYILLVAFAGVFAVLFLGKKREEF